MALIVSAGIIFKGNRILLAKRGPGGPEAYKWEFPGGKVEEFEDPSEALVREIREELDIEIKVKHVYTVVSYVNGGRHIVLIYFLCDYISGEAKAVECEEYSWADAEDLLRYQLAEADTKVARMLSSQKIGPYN